MIESAKISLNALMFGEKKVGLIALSVSGVSRPRRVARASSTSSLFFDLISDQTRTCSLASGEYVALHNEALTTFRGERIHASGWPRSPEGRRRKSPGYEDRVFGTGEFQRDLPKVRMGERGRSDRPAASQRTHPADHNHNLIGSDRSRRARRRVRVSGKKPDSTARAVLCAPRVGIRSSLAREAGGGWQAFCPCAPWLDGE